MPINPNIALSVQLPRALPTRTERQAAQIQRQQQQLSLKQLSDAQALQQVLRDAGGDPEKALPGIMQIDPVEGYKLQQQIEARKATSVKEQETAQTSQQDRALKILNQTSQWLPATKDQPSWDRFRQQVLSVFGPDVANKFPAEFDPSTRDQLLEQARPLADYFTSQKESNQPFTLTPGGKRFDAKGKEIASVPATPPAAPSGFNLSPGQTRFGADGKPIASLADRPPSATASGASDEAQNVKDAVQGMIDGTNPPMLPGRASKDYLAVMAEAKRRGYDLAQAATDWVATQKHIATMNGAQQLRLNQAINQLPELLDSVDALASKWKGGRFPILNKANLAAAKAGAYGADVASVATQLDAQIADVTADLGNVYMGGNSPTDHALDLAAKALSASWDEKVLHTMVDLARKNVKIRHNSIANTGVQGASPENPYAPPQAAPVAPPTGRYNPATGKIE